DHIEIGDNLRYTGGLFDPHWERTRPLVPIPLRFEIGERVLGDGSVLTPLDRADLDAVIRKLAREKIESVAVCFLNSYRNGSHEMLVGDAVEAAIDGIEVSVSSQIVPEWREYPRFSTAVMNAYVKPLLRGYLDELVSELRAGGCTGELLFMSSSTGLVSQGSASNYPVRLILSGPAAGVVAGIELGRLTKRHDLITYDMGGTSTDVCLVENLVAPVSSKRVLQAFPLMTPMVDVETVGAGGGSVVSVDPTGALRVGPESAGAEPGPVSYGRGGEAFTITDANLVLNRLSPAGLGGGKITLDRALATQAADRLNAQAGFDNATQLADAAVKIAVTNMCAAVREISVQRGHDPREFALVPFGGAGPMHATPIAEELGIPTIVVPPAPGNVCATGLLAANLRHDLVESIHTPLDEVDQRELEALLRALSERGRELLLAEKVPKSQLSAQYVLSMRYAGQSFELDVQVARPRISKARLAREFDALHAKTYGYSREGHPLELAHARVAVIGTLKKPSPKRHVARSRAPAAAAERGRRKVFFEGRLVNANVLERGALRAGTRFAGPAVVEEDGSVTVVWPGWDARVDEYENIVLERT
ncbi:MAG: hydantoinase/oxoprolinase family protein, partial [Gaiellaceae bacterium]